MSKATFAALEKELGEIHDIDSALSLLHWDMQCGMPVAASDQRASQIETISVLLHQRNTSEKLGALIQDSADIETASPHDSYEASFIRRARRNYELDSRVPTELKGRIAQAQAEGFAIWREARADSDFKAFLPSLEKQIELAKELIACYDPTESPYDVLLDKFEEGSTVDEVDRVFDVLKPKLIELTQTVGANLDKVDDRLLQGTFPREAQIKLSEDITAELGATETAWRVVETVHPFQQSFGTNDIRLATRYDEDFFSTSFYGTIHEFGHGLYEAQIDPRLNRTPLCSGVSMTLHESQSRLMENLVGRGRPFISYAWPQIRAAFPERFDAYGPEEFYRAVNKMQPSLIRVEADELTYGLHIILRYELERDLFEGRLQAADLPEVWNARMKEYLGVDVPDDASGVLQDVHWSEGLFGYFPDYLLGTVLSVQIWEAMRKDLPDLDEQIGNGDLAPLRAWLGAKIHFSGCKFTPQETIERAVGGPLDPAPYLRYLETKIADLYGI
ncbi:MAG TPA: carboxypeptidase M32 [Thermomicrobiales bacterium]|nr:carboxypeptidase M32 [Thermomicrobiales bacterium]